MPYTNFSKKFVVSLVLQAIIQKNYFPAQDSKIKHYSPNMIVNKENLDTTITACTQFDQLHKLTTNLQSKTNQPRKMRCNLKRLANRENKTREL